METTYDFEEIRILGEGLMASGRATLTSAGADYPGEFYVSEIQFDKGPTITRDVLKRPACLERFIFENLSRKIEESRDAQSEWADFEADAAPVRRVGSVDHRTQWRMA